MDQRQLQIVLKLQDQASAELRKALGNIDKGDEATKRWAISWKTLERGAIAAGAAMVGALGYGVKIAADLETAEVGLKTLLGSAEAARKTVARLKVEAARTPFELPGLTQATQLLTSVTKDGDKSIDILLDVGEALAAMGKGQAELDRIIVNLQQVAAVGKAATIDIKQFAFAGIPIYEMLAETTGKTGEALGEMIDNGEITFDLLVKMFDEANDAGGRFFNAYVNQSGTFNQAMSNMKDAFGIFMSDIAKGTGIFGGLTNAMITVSTILMNAGSVLTNLRSNINEFFAELEEKTGLITLFRDVWENVVFMYETRLRPALMELWEALKPLQPFLEAMAIVLGATLVGAITLLAMTLGTLAVYLVEILTRMTNLATFIMGIFGKAWDFITDKISGVIDVVDNLIERFQKAINLASKLTSGIGGKISGAIGAITGKASGGPVSGGTPYVVGEKGPELFVPRSSGSIVPNHALAGGGGIVVHVYGDVSGEELIDKVRDALGMDIKRSIRL